MGNHNPKYLMKLKPELLQEWDWERNSGIDPYQVRAYSSKKYYWICPKGHSWDCSPHNRMAGNKCRYCRGWLLAGENDLATLNPELALEWDYEKNGKLAPQMVTRFSHEDVWWKCPVGHSWHTTVASRSRGSGCSKCRDFGTSFPEQTILYYLQKCGYEVLSRDKTFGFELDIYIPSISTAVEYDGVYFHKSDSQRERDNQKDNLCSSKGIRLIRIREEGLVHTSSAECIDREGESNHSLEGCVLKLLELIGSRCSVDLEQDHIDILNQYYSYIKSRSIEGMYPDIAREWHPTANGKLLPSMVAPGMHQKVYWLCPNNHKYDASPAKRCIAGHGCRYCAGQEVIPGENDLLTINPTLAAEWDYERNDKTPAEVTPNSHDSYYWKCPKGHSYPAIIANRNKGKGCSFCSGRKRIPEVNSFAALHPELLKEIHPEQDIPFDPYSVGPMSDTEVRWICKEGHDWPAKVKKRSMGQGCPFCKNIRAWPGFNDLETKYPEIAKEWHPTLNGDITPRDVLPNSNSKVWWRCSKCGEDYPAYISNRTRKGTGHRNCKGSI